MWLSVDPLAEKFPSWSPYNYCLNNPLFYVDPDGRAPEDIIFILLKGKKGIGHAGVAISNYKKDEKGKYVEDGTYTYYDFGPTSGVSDKNFDETVGGKVSKIENVTMDDIKNTDPRVFGSDHLVTGVLKFETNKAYDDKIVKDFENSENPRNENYNLITNNCTTFTARAFNNISPGLGKETLEVDDEKYTLYTETKMYKDLSKTKGAKTILNPGSYINKTAQERYDEANDWFKK